MDGFGVFDLKWAIPLGYLSDFSYYLPLISLPYLHKEPYQRKLTPLDCLALSEAQSFSGVSLLGGNLSR